MFSQPTAGRPAPGLGANRLPNGKLSALPQLMLIPPDAPLQLLRPHHLPADTFLTPDNQTAVSSSWLPAAASRTTFAQTLGGQQAPIDLSYVLFLFAYSSLSCYYSILFYHGQKVQA